MNTHKGTNYAQQAVAAERMGREFMQNFLADLDARGIAYTVVGDEVVVEGASACTLLREPGPRGPT